MLRLDTTKYKAFIFDMDGTMVDSIPWHKKSYQILFEKLHLPFSEEFYKRHIVGHKNSEIFPKLFPQKDKKAWEELAYDKEAIFREIYKSTIKEIDGLTKLIDTFKNKGITLAIATTAPLENRIFYLDKLNLSASDFSAIVGDEEIVNGKPHPEAYIKAAERIGILPEKCLVFEDSASGIASAKSAGMTVVAVATNRMPETLVEADYVVDNFSEIEVV
jgi:beta-phosphoglucomutase